MIPILEYLINKTTKAAEEPYPNAVKEVPRPLHSAATAKIWSEASEKMRKWHEGSRKFNIGAASIEKLEINYHVCKREGYDQEANIIYKELQKRGVV